MQRLFETRCWRSSGDKRPLILALEVTASIPIKPEATGAGWDGTFAIG